MIVPVPPEILAVALPVEDPEHAGGEAVVLTFSKPVLAIAVEAVEVQLWLSVTVTE